MNHRRGFSLAELLAVVAIILLLVSFLLTGTQHLMSRSVMLKCQNRLEKIGSACQMFANENQRWPSVYDRETYLRWYEVLAPYADGDRRIFNCPELAAPGSEEAEDDAGPTESDLPMLLYNTGTGRCDNPWTDWGVYATLRGWLSANLEYGALFPQGDSETLVPLTNSMLSASSQVWFLNTEHYEYKRGGNVFEPGEVAAIAKFHQRGGGVQCWSESYRQDDYYRSTNNIIDACGDVGLRARPVGWSGVITWDMAHSGHPAMQDEDGYVTRMYSAYSPAYFTVENGDTDASLIGLTTVSAGGTPQSGTWPLIAAHDNGTARVLLHGSYTSLLSYGGWDRTPNDIRRYAITSDAWLRKSGGMRASGQCTYGYNSLVGLDAGRAGANTIVVMDYANWRIVRGQADSEKNDPASYIATRHEGKANALLGDGSVRAFYLEDIRAGMWTPAPGD